NGEPPISTKRRYVKSTVFSTVRSWRRGGGYSFVGGEGPVDVGRFHRKKERAGILADVGHVAAGASCIDGHDERAAADVAVNRHSKHSRSGSGLVARLPTQAQRAGVAQEWIGLHRPAAGPRPERA